MSPRRPTNTVDASAELNIANEYIVTIPDGTGSGDHHFPPSLSLKVGAKLRILDADSVAFHRIHGVSSVADTDFFPQASDMTQGQEFDMTMTMMGSGDFYCHDHLITAGKTVVTVVP